MEYKISYNSYNQYYEYVNEGFFEFLILPENNEKQMVSAWSIKNSLHVEPFYFLNLFGFKVCRIIAEKPFLELKVDMEVTVSKNDTGIVNGYILDESACFDYLNNFNFQIENHLFLQKSNFTNLTPANQSIFPNLKPTDHPYSYLSDLNMFIHNFLTYSSDVTTVNTTANELVSLKMGVCQDYAHLMIAIARINKIPSRYVSGYLHQGMGFLGASKMHAWVECYVPGAGWIGFDPTNNLKTDEHYIKVAHGCDYSDCTAIKGIILSSGKQITDHEVVVQAQQ